MNLIVISFNDSNIIRIVIIHHEELTTEPRIALGSVYNRGVMATRTSVTTNTAGTVCILELQPTDCTTAVRLRDAEAVYVWNMDPITLAVDMATNSCQTIHV